MKINSFSLGTMQSNCYLLENERKALLIDPGDSGDFLLEKIQSLKLDLVGIVATHGHFDHIMAVGEIQLTYPKLPLFIHPSDIFLLKRVVETANHFLGYDPVVVPISLTASLDVGTCLISNFTFDVIHTPGHTPGSCVLYFKEDKVLFSGDTLFKSGIGRYDFSYSDKELLNHSLKTILKLPIDTKVYSGHGGVTSIEDEQGIISNFF